MCLRQNNNTQQLTGPSTKDPKATYFAGITSLVQLASNGAVSFLPYTQGNSGANSAAQWTAISALSVVAPPTASSATSSATISNSVIASQSGFSPNSTGTAVAGSHVNHAATMRYISRGLSAALTLAAAYCLL